MVSFWVLIVCCVLVALAMALLPLWLSARAQARGTRSLAERLTDALVETNTMLMARNAEHGELLLSLSAEGYRVLIEQNKLRVELARIQTEEVRRVQRSESDGDSPPPAPQGWSDDKPNG